MKIGIDNALGMAPAALSLRAQRTALLANNIANADTPNYKAQDINFHAVLKQVQAPPRFAMKGTQDDHIQAQGQHATPDLQYRVPLMPSLDGNTVDEQIEQGEFAKNSLAYLATLRILNGRLGGMRTAIKGE